MPRLLTFWVCLFFGQALAADTYDLAIRDVTVINANESVPNQTVWVKNGTIQRVGPNQPNRSARQNIDGRGKFLIPGLWDMHVHIVYEEQLIDPMPELFLDYGITSVRDTGALLEKIAPQVQRWRSLGDEAPDLYFSGPLLDGRQVVYDGEGRPEIGVQNASKAQALKNFQAIQDAGASFIKIYELVTPEVFHALADAADQAGMPIAAHVPLSMSADLAGPRVGSMEHLRNVEISCAESSVELYKKRQQEIKAPGEKSGYELRRYLHQTQRTVALETANPGSKRCQEVIASLKNTIQVPTLRLNTISQYSPAARDDWSDHLNHLPAELASNWLATAKFYASQTSELGNKMADWSLSLVAAMVEAGVPVGAGTDTPIAQAIPGYSLHTELERMVDAGMTPAQALAAATTVPAQFFSLEDQKGKVAEGMEADLVLLANNPLLDIRNSRSIAHVIANGQVVR